VVVQISRYTGAHKCIDSLIPLSKMSGASTAIKLDDDAVRVAARARPMCDSRLRRQSADALVVGVLLASLKGQQRCGDVGGEVLDSLMWASIVCTLCG
jgi:hypothetical protein